MLDDLAEIMNAGRPEKNQLSNRYLGSKLRALGFTFLGRQSGTGRSVYELNGKLMELLAIRYGLKEAKKESQEIPSYTQEYASQTSQPSQTKTGQGFQGVKIGVKMCEDSLTFTDKNCEDSPTFTNLHSNLHSQEPHKYCTCEQCEDCEDNTRVRTGELPADIFQGEI